ncbi:protein KTI12-like isoform X1 [Dinothrombium tinctorium]|uniref:Protein KTI12 homolog n=1 Tax=Dinothrombium tinctorium TaxID=1965070 RepID=A0A443RDQ7_9ACAR|nr:protein KTI12-like isoform X1 [Dinothrombium tinctorium]
MPLIVISGIPCSGKTFTAKQLQKYFTKTKNVEAIVVSDNDLIANDANRVYERYRYELYCMSKESGNTHCVIECAVPKDEAWTRNERNGQSYSRKIFDELIDRYEAPDSRNRWDSPLFVVTPEHQLNFADVFEALFNRKAPPANQSTQSQPLSETNFLYQLNEETKSIVNHILKAQEMGAVKDIAIPKTSLKLTAERVFTSVELNKYRRQFITYTKQHPTKDKQLIPTLFVQYLNGIIE